MTKYIVCGGVDKTDTFEKRIVKIRDFYNEIISGSSEKVKILLCTFAKEDADMSNSVDKVKKIFLSISNKNVEFKISNNVNFQEQIIGADIVFFLGGRTEKLLNSINKYENIKYLFENKIVAGESAGANILCTESYSPRDQKITKGLSLLPIKIIPHYKQEYQDIFLEQDGLERLPLKEYEYKVYYT